MTPEERAKAALFSLSLCSGGESQKCDVLAEAIRQAENDALERAAKVLNAGVTTLKGTGDQRITGSRDGPRRSSAPSATTKPQDDEMASRAGKKRKQNVPRTPSGRISWR